MKAKEIVWSLVWFALLFAALLVWGGILAAPAAP
jgi:hypothetical protein